MTEPRPKTQLHTEGATQANGSQTALPLRDWLLLPLLGVATVAIVSLATEWIAGRVFRLSAASTLGCLVVNDPSTGVRAIPNSVCSQKTYESDLVEYRFNRCGHRAGMECGPKPPGTYRIVMLGSSLNFGMWVPQPQSFAALLPQELSARTGRRVQLYNESMQWGFPASAALRFRQVFDAQPDLILWPLTPTDIANSSLILPYVPAANPAQASAPSESNWVRVKTAFATRPIPDAVAYIWDRAFGAVWSRKLGDFRGSPTGILLQHILYASQSQYVRSYVTGPDSEVGFLRAQPSPEWEANLREFDRVATQVEGQARAAGVPLMAVLLPDRAQAAMISMGTWPPGYDPYRLDRELREIVVAHGGIYVDILPGFRSLPNPQLHYFPVDGHPDAGGHRVLSSLLAKAISSGAVPALKASETQTQPREQVK